MVSCGCPDTPAEECGKTSRGSYIFSKELSEISANDLDILAGLKIRLNEDGSFNMSKAIPHLNDSAGKWEVINELQVEGCYPYIRLLFNNGRKKDISCCCGSKQDFNIRTPYSLSDSVPSKYGFLSFVRVNEW
ncbi:MAG TPA: hypothetical protein VEC12_12255 [Bacteroidia bacterium]|nr:hypothetical protein [Bacteroidia bacterium]